MNRFNSSELTLSILSNSNIGLWSIEIDADCEPRLYADETMLRLIGITEELSPEQVYKFWYDRISRDHFEEVMNAVNKMINGDNVEIVYEWNHPENGWTYTRCSGTRNYSYTKGIMLEGAHRDVGNIIHIQTTMEQQRTDLEKSAKFQSLFTDSIVSAYYINLTDHSQVIFKRAGKLVEKYGAFDDYLESITKYINEDVHVDDRAAMLEAVQPDYIRQRLKNEQKFFVLMRDISGEKELYYKFQVMRGNDEEHVAMGFSDIDEEIRKEKASQNVIQSLANDFTGVIYADIESGEDIFVRFDERYLEYMPEWYSITDIFKRLDYLKNKIVYKVDRSDFGKATQKKVILKELETKSAYYVKTRFQLGNTIEYWQLKIVYSGPNKKHLIVGFLNIHSETLKEMKSQELLQRNFEIIEALSSEYSSVYYINLETEEIIPYSMNQDTQNAFGETFRNDIKYSSAFALYSELFINKTDRKKMLQTGSIENIKKQLNGRRSFEAVYLNYINRYCEMKVVKVGDSVEPKLIALGFADRDEEYRSELENKLYSEIANVLSRSYESVYYVDITDDSYKEFSLQGNFTQLNIKTTGKNFFKESHDNAYLCVYPEDIKRIQQFINKKTLLKNLDEQKNLTIEYRLVVNGKIVYYRLSVLKSSRDADHIIVSVVNIEKEVLERNSRQHELEQNLQIIDVLASEYSSVYYIDLETETLIPYTMNELTESKFGNIPEEGINFTDAYRIYVDNFVAEADKQMMLETGTVENIKSQLQFQKSFSTIYRSFDKYNPHYCEMKFVKVEDGFDEPKAVTLAFSDKDEEILKRFVDSKLYQDYVAIYIVNLDSDFIQTVMTMESDRLAKFTGYGIYSKWVSEIARLVCPEFEEQWTLLSNPVYVKGYLLKEEKREFSYKTYDGMWIRCAFRVLERNEAVPSKIIMTFMKFDSSSVEKLELDAKIADQKRTLEQQQILLEQALIRAESASKSKTTFLSNMSHDIRTPMNAIMGFTGLAMNNASDATKVRDYLSKISTSSQHLLSLINDILDMSRIECGKIQLEEVDCNLGNILQDLNIIIMEQAKAKQQNLYIDSFDVTDEDVVFDKLRLNQVLINLLSNAVKFTQVGGTIQVSVKQISSTSDKARFEFHVKDNGIGMKKEFMTRLFEPFERERSSTISKTQGTGLGMSITKNIVDLMGGTIKVYSKPQKGTEFNVTLTMRKQEKSVNLPKIDLFAGKRALVVNNDYNVCLSIVKLIFRLGLEVEFLIGSPETLEKIKIAAEENNPYTLFVIDDDLSEDSIELVKKIKKSEQEKSYIIMTSYDWNGNERIKEIEKDVEAFMTKPLFLSNLHSVLLKAAGLVKEEEKKVEETVSFTGKKVLLVEDNEMNREIAQEILESEGLIVDVAEDGSVAVQKLKISKPHTYDIVLMDVQMPVMNGYEATKIIRSLPDPEIARIPIIAMTANAFDEDRLEAFIAGMNEHISKPISIELLRETMKNYLL